MSRLTFEIPDGLVDELVERLLPLVLERLPAAGDDAASSPYMTPVEAAEFLRCKRARIDDLLSQRRLTRVKEGGRTLVLRVEVEALAAVDRVAHALPDLSRNGSTSGVAR